MIPIFDFRKKRPEYPPLPEGTVRRHYMIRGRVQGVGFRYRAMLSAQELGLTGWVLNLDDGSVEMEVQGLPEKISRLLPMVQESSFIRIIDFRVRDIPTKPRETRFTVRDG